MLEAEAAGKEALQQRGVRGAECLAPRQPPPAPEGSRTEHHRFLLRRLVSHLNYLESRIEEFSGRIDRGLRERLTEQEQGRLEAIPGVGRRTLGDVIAETGPDMGVFPDERHLGSWAGICPGNEEPAGKRLRGRTRKGNRWLRRALAGAAWGASHSRGGYLSAQYRRPAARRGKKRALLAVGHGIPGIIYHLLKEGTEYQDLGADCFDRAEPERLKRCLVKRLQGLGYEVNLEPGVPRPGELNGPA